MDGIKENHIKYVIVLMLLVITTILIITSQEGYDDKSRKDINAREQGSSLGISAEQVGSSPDSGVDSKAKQAYDLLLSLGDEYGSSSSPDWTYDYGTYWNRILYAAFWSPPGDATEEDVLMTKTFYSGSRVQKTGTLVPETNPGAYNQQYVKYDDYHASDYEGEESEWIQTSSATSAHVWQDTRTGLYWSSSIASYTNSFTQVSTGGCPFFNTDSYPTRGDYGTSGTDPLCGNAINTCAILSLATHTGQSAKTDWYLPSQVELQEAYSNGIYNQAGSTFTTTSLFWSSTEYSSVSTRAWYVYLHNGSTFYYSKTLSYATRCVRRD